MKYNEYRQPSYDKFLKDLEKAISLSDEELKEKNLIGVLSEGEYYEYCSRIIREIHNKYNIIISHSLDSYESYLVDKGVLEIEVNEIKLPKKKNFWIKLFNHKI